MARPKFPNLDKLAHGCINFRKENLMVKADDCRGIANDYTRLLEYITELQDTIIQLKQDDVITVELDNGEF